MKLRPKNKIRSGLLLFALSVLTTVGANFIFNKPSLAGDQEIPPLENSLARCVRTQMAYQLHPDRVKAMPQNIVVYNYYGHTHFNSASTIDLHATHGAIDAYVSGHMGFASPGEFEARGRVIETQFDLPGGLANVADALKSIGDPKMSLLDHNQTLPIGIMVKNKYLNEVDEKDELEAAATRHPNQIIFLSGTRDTDSDTLKANNNGQIPKGAYPDPKDAGWRKYTSAFAGYEEPANIDYVEPIASAMLVSGQSLTERYQLLIETPDLEKPIPESEGKFLVARGSHVPDEPGSFREEFRGVGWFAYYRFLLRDSIAHPDTHEVHPSKKTLATQNIYAQVNSLKNLDHFTKEGAYGFKFYSGFKKHPNKFAVREALSDFVDGEGIEKFSATLGRIVKSSDDTLTGREAMELLVDTRMRATTYLTGKAAGKPLEVEMRDFSNGLGVQIDLQLNKSAALIPGLAPKTTEVSHRLKQVDPIIEHWDETKRYAEHGAGPYNSWVRGNEESLRDFLKEQNAVEVTVRKGDLDQKTARRVLIGAYLDYVGKLKRLGVKEPEKMIERLDIHFALTTSGNDYHSTYGIPESSVWEVQKDAIWDLGNPFFYQPSVMVPETHARADVFTASTVRNLMGEEPKITRSLQGSQALIRGQDQFDRFMKEPELFAP